MPTKPRDVHVQVFIHPGDPMGDYHFETSDLPMGPNNHLYFHNCDHPGLHVHYDIQPGTNYVFPDKSMTNNWRNEALWATSGTSCPTSQPNPQWPTFKAEDIENSGTTLVVHNANGQKEDFWYTLRVTNDGGQHYLPLDPGGTNENGAYRYNVASIGIALVGGAVAGTLVTLGVQSLMMGS